MFLHAEMMSPAQVLAEIETFEFNEEDRVQPQIEVMNISIAKSKTQQYTVYLFLLFWLSATDLMVFILCSNMLNNCLTCS